MVSPLVHQAGLVVFLSCNFDNALQIWFDGGEKGRITSPLHTILSINPLQQHISSQMNSSLKSSIIFNDDDRSTLYRLSLVSWKMKSIAQTLLFWKINDIGTMSSRAYIRFFRCRRKPYRHVLQYVHRLMINLPLRKHPYLNNRALLFSILFGSVGSVT
jgi:hypothetical protein